MNPFPFLKKVDIQSKLLFYQIKNMGPLEFCLSIFLWIHKNPKQNECFDSCDGFLMAKAIPAHSKKLPEWHFLTP